MYHLQVSAGACRDHVPSQQRDVRHSALHRVQEVRLHVLQEVDRQPEDHGHHRLGPPDGTRLRQEVRQKFHSGLHCKLLTEGCLIFWWFVNWRVEEGCHQFAKCLRFVFLYPNYVVGCQERNNLCRGQIFLEWLWLEWFVNLKSGIQ